MALSPQQAGMAKHSLETLEGGLIQAAAPALGPIPQQPKAAAIPRRDLPVVVVHAADRGPVAPQQGIHIGELKIALQGRRRDGSAKSTLLH